jgi:uncharacterized protein (DUF1786 family)
MSPPGWITTLVSPALTLDGRTTQVATGHMQRDDRRVLVLQIGDDGTTAVLLPAAVRELIANLTNLTEGEAR